MYLRWVFSIISKLFVNAFLFYKAVLRIVLISLKKKVISVRIALVFVALFSFHSNARDYTLEGRDLRKNAIPLAPKLKVKKEKSWSWDPKKIDKNEISTQQTTVSVERKGRNLSPLKGLNIKDFFPKKKEKPKLYNLDKKFDTKSVKQSKKEIKIPIGQLKDIRLNEMAVSDSREKELLALSILFEKLDSCSEVIALGHKLILDGVKRPEVYFYMGTCNHRYRQYSESIPQLSKVISYKDPYYLKKSLEVLLSDVPPGYEDVIGASLAPREIFDLLSQEHKDHYNYIIAKGKYISGEFKFSEKLSEIISQKSQFYNEGQLLLGLSLYMNSKKLKAIETVKRLRNRLDRKSESKDFMSLVSNTLGRFYFDVGDYKNAIKEFSKVDKNHPMFIDSLIDKGWAQIQASDYPGAIGNMFSLGAPFYKTAFIPESKIIESIAYLKVCDFPKSSQSLSFLEERLAIWDKQISRYLSSGKDIHDTLKGYLKGPSDKNYDGLPYQIIRELGRDKSYLVSQKKLNNIIDEIDRNKTFLRELINKRKSIKNSIKNLSSKKDELRQKIADFDAQKEFDKARSLETELETVHGQLAMNKYRMSLLNTGIVAYKKYTGKTIFTITKIKNRLKKETQKTLLESLKNIKLRVDQLITNNELLRFEIFDNSGRNIRYKASGGKFSGKIIGKRPNDTFGWGFVGEFWEDEVGKLRAQIKDQCPTRG